MKYQKIREFLASILGWLAVFFFVVGIFLFFTGIFIHEEWRWELAIFGFLYGGLSTTVWVGLRKRIREFDLTHRSRTTPNTWR